MRLRIAIVAAFLTFVLPVQAYAATVIVDNYFYAHSNQPGSYPFRDKYGNTGLYGDGIEFDAQILSIDVEAFGMGPGDSIVARSSGGQTWPVMPGTTTTVSVPPNQSLSITLNKSGYNEVLARLAVMRTYDASNGGTNVTYTFSLNDMPTRYGDLGPGSEGGGGDEPQTVQGNYYYFPPRDAYKYDYSAPAGASRYELHFIDESGNTLYKRDYEHTPTGVHYLTCNGIYEMRFFDSTGNLIAKSPWMYTTEISNPSCSSYAGTGSGFSDFPASKIPNGDGTAVLDWDDMPGASYYELYHEGQKIGETTESQYTVNNPNGAYTIVARDSAGNIVGQSDIPASESGSDPGGDDGGCGSVCDKLEQLLDCPGWDRYLGDLTDAIRDALPPPPNWDEIADKIGAATIRHLSAYLGDVPEPPSRQEIGINTYQDLPNVDNSVPESNQLVPTMPPDFNTPKPFDIENGPQIEVVDESRPFTITDPLSGIGQIDEPGTPVIPGDPRNDSGGIKTPDQVDTGGPAVPAQPSPEPPPVPSGGGGEVPPDPMPMPTVPESDVPVPVIEDSPIPIPTLPQ